MSPPSRSSMVRCRKTHSSKPRNFFTASPTYFPPVSSSFLSFAPKMSASSLRTPLPQYSRSFLPQLTHSDLRSSSSPSISFTPRISVSRSLISPSLRLYKGGVAVGESFGFSVRASSSMAGIGVEKGRGKLNIFDSEEELAGQLAKYTADLSEKVGKRRGAFTVVVSGGSLIKSLRKLTELPYADSIDWSKWHVFWVDERVVPKDHPDSNYKLAYDGFLSKVPIPPGNVYAINEKLSAEEAAYDYETCVKHLVSNGVIDKSSATGFPKFDLMLLGMGPDGHVASLFPGHPLVQEDQKLVTFIKDSPKPPPERITLTLPVINSSAYIALVVCGAGKAGVVQTALGSNEDSLPVGMVSPEGELTWFLDKEAASKL